MSKQESKFTNFLRVSILLVGLLIAVLLALNLYHGGVWILQGLNGSPLNNAPRETVPDDSSDSHSDIGRIRTRTMRPVPEWTMAFFPLRSFLSSGGTADPVSI